jgi:glycosyltransferase involved in cell wall biosynthesis
VPFGPSTPDRPATEPAVVPVAPLRTLQLGMNACAKDIGGLDRYYYNLLRYLPAAGVLANGIVVGGPDDLPEGFVGQACGASSDVGMLTRWRAFRKVVPPALEQADVVVSHFAPYAFPVLDSLSRRPYVVHFHGSWALEGAAEGALRAAASIKHLIERMVYRKAARFIVLSQAYADLLHEEFNVNPALIRVTPGGVDITRFRAVGSRGDARRTLGLSEGRPIVLTARRLVRAKGLENLIDAIALAQRRVPEIQLLIAGNGPLEALLKRRVAEKGLESAVRFLGFVDDGLPLLFQAADLSIVPTLAYEGFGLVVIESLAVGTPCLVTPVSGLPDTVHDLNPGLVLEGTDAQSLARGICDALDGSLKLPGEAACVAFAERFAWPHIAAQVATVYREIAP